MEHKMPCCKGCQSPLKLEQTCLNIFWHCQACGKNHRIEDFLECLDEKMEERLANVRCNRI